MDGNLFKYLQGLKPQDPNAPVSPLDQPISGAASQPIEQPDQPQVLAGGMQDILTHGFTNSTAVDPNAEPSAAATGVDVSSALNENAAPPRAAAAAAAPAPEQSAQAPEIGPRGFGSELNDDALKAAQAMQQSNLQKSNLSKGFSTMNAALGGVKPDYSFEEGLDKQSSIPVENILARRKGLGEEQKYSTEQAAQDPNSPDNQAFRSYIKENLPGLAKSPGFDKLTLANPAMEKIADMYTKSQDRKAALAQSLQNHQDMMLMAGRKQNSLDNQRDINNQTKASKNLEQNPYYKEGAKKELEAKSGLDVLEQAKTNPIANGGKAIQMARAFVSGGRINAQEINALGGSKAIMDRLDQMQQNFLHGTMTDANYGFYKSLLGAMQKSASDMKSQGLLQETARTSKHLGVSPEEAKNILTGGQTENAAGFGGDSARNPSTSSIDPNDPKVKQALAAGYTMDEIKQHLSK